MATPTPIETPIPPAVVLPGLNLIGWVPPAPDLSIEHWGRTLDALMSFEQATPWELGDLYLFAQARGKEYWELAQQQIPMKHNQTIMNYAVVCRVFPRNQRRSGVSIAHHVVVTKIARKDMAQAQKLLEYAEINELTALELRAHVNGGPETAIETTATKKTGADIGWQGPMLAEAAALIEQFCEYPATSNESRHWLTRYNQHISGYAAK